MGNLLKGDFKISIEDKNEQQIVTVNLFNKETGEVFSTDAILNEDGTIKCEFSEEYTGAVIVCIFAKQGAFLATYSAREVEAVDNVITYDFTTSVSQAYGDNQVLVDGVACFYNGDLNQDLSIDGTDVAEQTNNPRAWVNLATVVKNSGGGDNPIEPVFAITPIGAPIPAPR